MQNLLFQTENIAYDYLKSFGFSEEQVKTLINKGKIDLTRELEKLALLLYSETIQTEKLNDSLHAIKGLLSHLGHIELVEILNDIKWNNSIEEQINILKNIINFHV